MHSVNLLQGPRAFANFEKIVNIVQKIYSVRPARESGTTPAGVSGDVS